eukprot:SAG31_NODE_3233_length_4512_cov_72.476773_3_plen_245_part_00
MVDAENLGPLLLNTIRDHWSDDDGGLSIVEQQLSRGAPVDAADRMGSTALARAATLGTLPVVQALLRHGAQVDHRNTIGRSPFHCACSAGHADAALLLVQHGADSESRTGGMAASGEELATMAGHHELALLLRKLSQRHPNAATGPALQRLAWAFGWHKRLGERGKLASISADIFEMVARKVVMPAPSTAFRAVSQGWLESDLIGTLPMAAKVPAPRGHRSDANGGHVRAIHQFSRAGRQVAMR